MSSEDNIPLNTAGHMVGKHENGAEKSSLDKARTRLIQEGYKYNRLPDEEDDSMRKKSVIKWSQRERHYICVLVITTVLIAAMASLLVWQYLENKDKNICSTESCVRASASILNKIDSSVDPCVNFYEFVCGNWEKTTNFPDSKPKYGSFTELSDTVMTRLRELLSHGTGEFKGQNSTAITKAKAYFGLCMDIDTIEKKGKEPLLKLVEQLGSWTVVSDDQWSPENWSLGKALVANHQYGLAALFSMSVSGDDHNSSINIISFQQAGLTLGDQSQYDTNTTKYNATHEAFVGYAKEIGKLMGAENDVTDKVESIWQFEQSLAKIFIPKEELINPEDTYHRMTVAELENLTDYSIPIQDYLSDLFGDKIPEDEDLLVYTPIYFEKLGALIKNTDKEVIANYIIWNVVINVIGYMPKAFIDAAMNLQKLQFGISELDPRWERCVSKVSRVLMFAVGALYVDEAFPGKSKKEVGMMVEHLRQAFIENLPDVKWMDDETRELSMEKAKAISKMIGYPDWILIPNELDKYYEEFHLTDGGFFESHMAGMKMGFSQILNRRGKIPDRTEWHMSPAEVNAYYTSTYNSIVFPASILQQPFYSPVLPQSFNFGSIGMVMGHELTHGFDNTGRMYDKFGNLNNWWTNKSAEGFEKHSQCMIDLYSSYKFQGAQVNGKTTLGENIADNGGLKAAYMAYMRWKGQEGNTSPLLPGIHFSPEQLFYIGFGQIWCAHYTQEYAERAVLTDVHSPSMIRVLAVISNNEKFGEAFNCPVGSPMNPKDKCKVW
ncbi:hypothetical protein ScPMuIL_003464 [Solemya velum]